MCGIIGVAGTTISNRREWLTRGSSALQHRGPDGNGEWWSPDQRVGFGHRRLAIVDLSSSGSQPMLDSGIGNCITFNGEVYNYRELRVELESLGRHFKSTSDTEVILAAYAQWGTGCVARLHGMFAFAIYDVAQKRLFLARDRAGEKPLFIYETSSEILFASELKALLSDGSLPRYLDLNAFKEYLYDGFVASERCILTGFRKLPPAHALTFELETGKSRQWAYWCVESSAPLASRPTLEELVNELEVTLERAVKRQLVADVPVGLLLSGGVDSSLIAALASRHCSALNTFTVAFGGHSSHDESAHARLIANHFGTQHHEIVADPATVDLLPLLARQYDEPVNDSSMLPTYLVTRYVRKHCKVVLGGDGGDELFGGYPHYDRILRLARIAKCIPYRLRAAIADAARVLAPSGMRARNWALGLACNFDSRVPAVTALFDQYTLSQLLKIPIGPEPTLFERRTGETLMEGAIRRDFEFYLTNDLLVKVDRASMLNSLEVRAPLLDVEVMDFALNRTPVELKVSGSCRKIVPKALAAKILPPRFDRVRKQGFSLPLSKWLREGPWRKFFKEVLLDPKQNLFDRDLILKMLRNESTLITNAERMFGMVLFELWRKEYKINLS